MVHYRLPAEEIELCKQAYRDNPEAHRTGYAAMAALLRFEIMAAGINERIRATVA